jgi:CRP-like cAMP-binding protein
LAAQSSGTNGNRLLAALATRDFARVESNLEPVSLPLNQILLRRAKPITHIYFPQRGVVSLVQRLRDGGVIEVGLIGNEGLVGVPVLLGASTAPVEAMVQIPGSALRIQTHVLQDEITGNTALVPLLLRYAQALHIQITQTAACNGRHTLRERLARWLLMAHDRSTSDDLPLNHEFLSMMLGVRRSGVTVALSDLKSAGAIDSGRSNVTIVDRKGLREASCECYDSVRREYQRLLP